MIDEGGRQWPKGTGDQEAGRQPDGGGSELLSWMAVPILCELLLWSVEMCVGVNRVLLVDDDIELLLTYQGLLGRTISRPASRTTG